MSIDQKYKTKVEAIVSDKHSSLLQKFVNYGPEKVL